MKRPAIDDPSFWRPTRPDPEVHADPPEELKQPPEMASAMEPRLTRAEVAAMFRVVPETVSNWVKWGWLRSVGPGRRLLFRLSDIEAMVERKISKPKQNCGSRKRSTETTR
jgi:hypothetical protein